MFFAIRAKNAVTRNISRSDTRGKRSSGTSGTEEVNTVISSVITRKICEQELAKISRKKAFQESRYSYHKISDLYVL